MAKPRRGKVAMGWPDIHYPFEDKLAIAVAKAAQRHLCPDITVQGGDLLDCSMFSRHPLAKIDEAVALDWEQAELKPANALLDWIQRHTLQTTYVIEGNHEAWVERMCANGGRAWQSIASMILPSVRLSRGRNHFHYIPYVTEWGKSGGHVMLHPKLAVVHGWTASKHAARQHLDKARSKSIIFHHTHRTQSEILRDPWSHEPVSAMSAGCLCKLQPMYAHGGNPSEWTHGFWVAYIGKHSFKAYSINIDKGTAVLPDGKEIKV